MLLQALCEGGWSQNKEEDEEKDDKKADDEEIDTSNSENKMVESILKKDAVSKFQPNYTCFA